MVASNAHQQNQNSATVESVSSLSANLERHPNFVKSSNQLKYFVLVQSASTSSSGSQDTHRTVKLTSEPACVNSESHVVESVHGYLSDLPPKTSARNDNCELLAPRSTFCPLITSSYTTREHLARRNDCADSSDSVAAPHYCEAPKQKSKCAATAKTVTIADLFAKMKGAPKTIEPPDVSKKCLKMQYGDHEYCSTKVNPPAKALQKPGSKLKSPKALAMQPIVKVEEAETSSTATAAATSSKRHWIDTSSDEDEEREVAPSSSPVSKRVRKASPKRDRSSPVVGPEVPESGVVKKVKTASAPAANVGRRIASSSSSTSKRSSRSSAKKALSQKQSVLSFVRKSSK